MKDNYLAYYKPLVQKFCRELDGQDLEGLDHMPQPFLPLFGTGYETSSLRLLIMGQDTKGWGQCNRFIAQEMENPGVEIIGIFEEIENRNFTRWGRNTHSFWGFAMALLAGLHGVPNWNALKYGEHKDILGSFAWANANAVELWGSLLKHTHGVPWKTWQVVRNAGAHFNRLSHILNTMSPDVVLITCKTFNKAELFFDLDWQESDISTEGVRHYRLNGHDVDILHTYHPGYMRNVGGPWSYLNAVRELLQKLGHSPNFPEFVTQDENGNRITDWLLEAYLRNEKKYGKYEFIEWVAEELNKHGAFMAVPVLAHLLNKAGFNTNYGTHYIGKRGSYRLVRGAYNRAANRGDVQVASKVAEAFRKPNFTYAY